MVNSLQSITDAWGKWMNDKHKGGGIKFTESTDYTKHSELDQYHTYQTNVVSTDINYDPNAPSPTPGTVTSIATTYENGTSVAQSFTYQRSETTSRTFSWSITESLSVGVEVNGTVGTPGVASVGMKVTATVALSSNQTTSTTDTQTWQVTEPIVAPPHTVVTSQVLVHTDKYDINFTTTSKLRGYVAIWFKNKVYLSNDPKDLHYLWFVPIEEVFRDVQQNKLIDTSGYQISGSSVIATAKGNFFGGQGTAAQIKVSEKPYPTTKSAVSTVEAATPETHYTIPISESGHSAIVGA